MTNTTHQQVSETTAHPAAQALVSLNIDQFNAILNALDIPARLCDKFGSIVAQNRLATAIAAAALWDEAEKLEQVDGCTLLLLQRQPKRVTAPTPVEDIGTLANGMAHSIRNPLSSIITAASLVNDDPNVSEETVMLLGVITKESRHLNQILTDFLSYVRPHPSQQSRFDIGEALQATVRTLRQDGTLSDQIIVVDELPSDLWVEGDETQIRQALWNIVRNAGEAMSGGGTLSLSGSVESGKISLSIGDTGRGFSEKELARAFDPFFSNTSEGTGLGLTVARSTLAAIEGTIRIENKPAPAGTERGGACIVLQLPEAPASA